MKDAAEATDGFNRADTPPSANKCSDFWITSLRSILLSSHANAFVSTLPAAWLFLKEKPIEKGAMHKQRKGSSRFMAGSLGVLLSYEATVLPGSAELLCLK